MEGCLFFCRVWTSKARITKQVHTTALTSISILGIYFGVISILIWYTEFIGSAFYTIRFRAGFIRKAEERMDPFSILEEGQKRLKRAHDVIEGAKAANEVVSEAHKWSRSVEGREFLSKARYKLYVNKKLFSIKRGFYVLGEQLEKKYYVKTDIFTVNRPGLRLLDIEGEEIGRVKAERKSKYDFLQYGVFIG